MIMQKLRTKQSQEIPEAVKHFSQLSPECQVRLPVVKALLSVSSATVWRMVKAKKLTAYKLTERTTSFNVAELRKLLSANEV